jgi:hypothetical protein
MGDSTTTMKRGDVAMNCHQRSKDVKHAAWEHDPQKKLTLFTLFGIG